MGSWEKSKIRQSNKNHVERNGKEKRKQHNEDYGIGAGYGGKAC